MEKMFHHNMKASTVRTYHCSGSEHGVVKGTGEELVVGSVDGVAALEGDNIHTYRGRQGRGREKVRERMREDGGGRGCVV